MTDFMTHGSRSRWTERLHHRGKQRARPRNRDPNGRRGRERRHRLRSEENLKAAEERVLDETGADPDAIDWVVCDLEDEQSIRSATQAAVGWLGTLDALVTNHVAPPSSTFTEANIKEFDAAYESVLRCTLLLCQEALPALRDGGGSITHLVAISSLEPTSNGALGYVFRPGIYGLSKIQANELGDDGIRVNCIAPRGVVTDGLVETLCR